MVVLNKDLVLKWNRHLAKFFKTSEDDRKMMENCSHLYLNDKKIANIGDISLFTNTTTIYLHNNQLRSLTNIGALVNLTHLYLQRNKLTTIHGLEALVKLEKLYLGYNEISVIEGLENQNNLHLLHAEHQVLQSGDSLYFDPRTLSTLSECLQDIDISHNHISSIKDLQCLVSLKHINLKNNALNNIDDVCATVKQWNYAIDISLGNNPICKLQDYKNRLLLACSYTVSSLNGKPVSQVTKVFLQNFEKEKLRRKSNTSLEDVFSSEVQSLVKHLPEGLCQAVSAKVLKVTMSAGGDAHVPVPVSFPLDNLMQPSRKLDSEVKYGLRGSKPLRKIIKHKTEEIQDIQQTYEINQVDHEIKLTKIKKENHDIKQETQEIKLETLVIKEETNDMKQDNPETIQ